MNNLPRVVTQPRPDRESNSRPLDRKSPTSTVAFATTPPVRLNNYCKLDAVFSLLPSNASCGVFKSHELSTASRFTALESSENMRSPRSYGIYINVTKTQFGESSNCQIGLNRHSFHFVTSLSFRYAIRSIELHQR